MNTQHEQFIRRCLLIAEKARGAVGTGAMVGAVLVRQGRVIAEGIHPKFGAFHAERNLLLECGEPVQPDDTLYVNLEPCVPHPTKKTPPCTEIILEKKVRHLVYGMGDPDTRVSGRGLKILTDAGVKVSGPVLEAECRKFNRGFVSVRLRNRPYVTAVRAAKNLVFDNGVWEFPSGLRVPLIVGTASGLALAGIAANHPGSIDIEVGRVAGQSYTNDVELLSAVSRAALPYIGATEVALLCEEGRLSEFRAADLVDSLE